MRKRVPMFWIPAAAGMTTGRTVEYVTPPMQRNLEEETWLDVSMERSP